MTSEIFPGPLSRAQLAWLQRLGVPIEAIGSLGDLEPLPFAIRTQRVAFHDDRYEPHPLGERALIAPIIDEGAVVDLAAWTASTIATRDGVGYAVGQWQLDRAGAGTTGRALPVHRSVIGWLRAGRRGIVVADWDRAAHALAGAILAAEDDDHARELERRLRVPPPTITVRRRKAAA